MYNIHLYYITSLRVVKITASTMFWRGQLTLSSRLCVFVQLLLLHTRRNPLHGCNSIRAEVSGASQTQCKAHSSGSGLSRSLDQNTVTQHRNLLLRTWDVPS